MCSFDDDDMIWKEASLRRCGHKLIRDEKIQRKMKRDEEKEWGGEWRVRREEVRGHREEC